MPSRLKPGKTGCHTRRTCGQQTRATSCEGAWPIGSQGARRSDTMRQSSTRFSASSAAPTDVPSYAAPIASYQACGKIRVPPVSVARIESSAALSARKAIARSRPATAAVAAGACPTTGATSAGSSTGSPARPHPATPTSATQAQRKNFVVVIFAIR
jgi:hypothetical protein